jgi:RHH-type transcriptional regulator, proline utilization regulon repressor / proline dehydrogenase / delta 1-pyrroline-5-carboxylate dehydrogenase
MALPVGLPPRVAAAFAARNDEPFAAALVEGDAEAVSAAATELAGMAGPIMSLYAADRTHGLAYCCERLLEEVSTSINTTAAGGNASLMMIG